MRDRVKLLRQLVRLREVEKRNAALRLAQSERVHTKLQALGERSGGLAASYAKRADAGSGAELARLLGFAAGIARIHSQTEAERRSAEATSVIARANLRVAERRREVTGERLEGERRVADRRAELRQAPATSDLARKLKVR